MKTDQDTTKPAVRESTLTQVMRREIEQGLRLAADPRNADLVPLAIRVTTIYSPWFSALCKVCKHKFREGDRVRLCPRCDTPYHDDDEYHLRCWQNHFQGGHACTEGGEDRFSERPIPACGYRWDGHLPDEPNSGSSQTGRHGSPLPALVEPFVAGLETICRPFGGLRPVQVAPGSALVGRRCPWCRFDIRAGDWVVPCPCGCGTIFHQDVFRHFTCWNEWSGVQGKDYCPTTGRSYRESTDAGE